MLDASYAYLAKPAQDGRPAGSWIRQRESSRSAKELMGIVDRFSEMASDLDGRFSPLADGDHAWISIVDGGFVLHAYFCRCVIRFELYGPTPVGKETRHADPYD